MAKKFNHLTRSVLGPSSALRTISLRFCLGLSSVFSAVLIAEPAIMA